jgi:glycerol-3-phosphate acyltransferase PlsX
MGGDFAPAHEVAGAFQALAQGGGRFSIVLVGRRDRLDQELRKHGSLPDGCTVEHAPDVIDMQDSPTAALKAKKGSSIAVALQMVRDGRAQAFVSAGNTGAVFSASTLILGRLDGIGRPTIGALLPSVHSPCFLVDAGANVDCRASHLYEFGLMGSIYMTTMLGKASPRVGLVNVGEEESKGNEVSQEAYRLLRNSSLNFVGNIEGRDILRGAADVAVCDGFVGNIVLKFGESVPGFLKAKFKAYAGDNIVRSVTGLIARDGLRAVMKEMDYQEQGGVPILGVQGVSIIGHGSSTPKAMKNMMLRADEMARRSVNTKIQEALRG